MKHSSIYDKCRLSGKSRASMYQQEYNPEKIRRLSFFIAVAIVGSFLAMMVLSCYHFSTLIHCKINLKNISASYWSSHFHKINHINQSQFNNLVNIFSETKSKQLHIFTQNRINQFNWKKKGRKFQRLLVH